MLSGAGEKKPPANQKPPDTMEGNALGVSLSLPDCSRDANRASTHSDMPASVLPSVNRGFRNMAKDSGRMGLRNI